jgi:hypothetical protein
MKARFAMSMTSNTASCVPRDPPVTSCGFAGGETWCAGGKLPRVWLWLARFRPQLKKMHVF